MIRVNLAPRRTVERRVLALVVLVALFAMVAVPTRPHSVDAALAAGTLRVVAGPDTPGAGQDINEGGSDRSFTFIVPTAAACAGDSATDGYRVHSYMVPASVDPGSLTFDSSGPIPMATGAVLRLPLFNASTGSGFVNANTSVETGLVIGVPAFSFGVFADSGASAAALVPEGIYNLGLACTLGQPGPSQLDRYWNVQFRFTHDALDQGGLTWAVVGISPPPPTTTTTAPTSTTQPSITSTTAATTLSTTQPSTTSPASSTSTTRLSSTSTSTTTSTTGPPSTTTTAPTSTTVPGSSTTVPGSDSPNSDVRIGSQGIDTSLASTDSQVTVNGRGRYADLSITINQTKDLTNQTVSIIWTGGVPTAQSQSRFSEHFLQIFQCWGEDDLSVPGNPGPPPEQCVQGSLGGLYEGTPRSLYPNDLALSRIISRSGWENFDPSVGVLESGTTNVWMPFRAVDGTVIEIQTDPKFNPSVQGGDFWINPYFDAVTSNEVPASATDPSGRGGELMQVLTGVESSGLGCGQQVPQANGGSFEPKCWIVVVPRGSATDENQGTPFGGAAADGIATSPLTPASWQNRIAIALEFNPVDSPCELGSNERRINGTELALRAVVSWQPRLCESGNLPPFSYGRLNDSTARNQLERPAPGAPGMIVVSRPIANPDPANPIVYAPLTVSGITIGFNLERTVRLDAPSAEQDLRGVRIADINLTPRLVAKLLTQSYGTQVNILGIRPPAYVWAADNPSTIAEDPDFVQFNAEFSFLTGNDRTLGGLILPSGNSDAALLVWEWILADPEASTWLAGTPDPWGMKVNPVYATQAAANSFGVPFASPTPNSFPKSDPYCYQAPDLQTFGTVMRPPPLCTLDWLPYSSGFADAAEVARRASIGAKINLNTFAQSTSEIWKREEPQYLGRRSVLVVTDTPSAALFGLQTARLSRAGDNAANRVFLAPDGASLTAGVAAMRPGPTLSVLEPNALASAPGAYPLTVVTYAAAAPLALDASERVDYAAFLEYAGVAGQQAGRDLGQLPVGYTPLPDALRVQTQAAAGLIRDLVPVAPAAPAAPTATTPPVASVTSSTAPISSARPTRSAPASSSVSTPVAGPTSVPVDEPSSAPETSSPPTTAPAEAAERAATPAMPIGSRRLVLPALAFLAVLCPAAALEVTKWDRQAVVPSLGRKTRER